MKEQQPTTRQIVLFSVVLSFVVSVIGTTLALGVFGPLFSGESGGAPILFSRPKIFQQIADKVAPPERQLRQDELIVKAVEDASPAVVSIVASKDVPVIERYYVDPFGNDPFFQQFFGGGSGLQVPQYRQKGTQKQDVSSGTGFIVSSDGLILTNKHVVADTEAEFTVLMNDGRKKPAKVLARDTAQDLAVLKIEGQNLPAVRFGDSSQVKIGQAVIAIGNALGQFRNTVSVGVISGLERSITAGSGGGESESLQELIQTDAAINPGNSGGPLLNIAGEVIGIDTAMATGAENIGFALPINSAKRDVASVKAHGKILYPFLGVRYILITKEIAEKEKLGRDYGARIMKSDTEAAVVAGSPADKAGLKDGDIILQLNNERIDPSHTLASLTQKYQVGDEITLRIFRAAQDGRASLNEIGRDGKESDVKVKLEERK